MSCSPWFWAMFFTKIREHFFSHYSKISYYKYRQKFLHQYCPLQRDSTVLFFEVFVYTAWSKKMIQFLKKSLNLLLCCHMPIHDSSKNPSHLLFTKLIDGDHVEMAQETGRDWITPTSGRTHGGHQLDVCQVDGCCVFQIVPVVK